MDTYIVKGEEIIWLIDPRDIRDKGWLLLTGVRDVILTIREAEDSEPLLTLHGTVEYMGTSVDDPAKLAVHIHTQDTYKLSTGIFWYDITIIRTGHWFDIDTDDFDFINEYAGLYMSIGYGRIKKAEDGVWIEIEKGWVQLTDNATNCIQVTEEGLYIISLDDFVKEGEVYLYHPLYKVITLDGRILDYFPHSDWLEYDEEASIGLEFVYKAGKYVDANYNLQDVEGGSIILKPFIKTFIEIDTDGVVSSNITRFTEGAYPLYTVETDGDNITSYVKQETGLILDSRHEFVRGDGRTPSVKAQVEVMWTPTQIEEDEEEE